MAKQQGVTADDRAKVVRVSLAGIADGVELGEIAARHTEPAIGALPPASVAPTD